MAARKSASQKCEAVLRAFALGFPETHEDFPWGERVVKVRKKVFVFMGHSDGAEGADRGLTLSVKLPESQTIALMLPFTEPSGYGLGKSGWITARFSKTERPPEDMLCEWIEESYRAVAPKKLTALLSAGAPKKTKAARSKK